MSYLRKRRNQYGVNEQYRYIKRGHALKVMHHVKLCAKILMIGRSMLLNKLNENCLICQREPYLITHFNEQFHLFLQQKTHLRVVKITACAVFSFLHTFRRSQNSYNIKCRKLPQSNFIIYSPINLEVQCRIAFNKLN